MAVVLGGCSQAAQTRYPHVEKETKGLRWDDWEGRRSKFGALLENAPKTSLSIEELEVSHYEYGRASGVLCHFDDAEEHLLKSVQFTEQSSGPVYMPLVELARLNYDQKKYPEAIAYFERTLPVLQQFSLPQLAPIDTAEILEEYARALYNVRKDEASKIVQKRAEKLRRDNPGFRSHTDRTPYGAKCG
jgi:tetratricopeptide (TPR) repeat protein